MHLKHIIFIWLLSPLGMFQGQFHFCTERFHFLESHHSSWATPFSMMAVPKDPIAIIFSSHLYTTQAATVATRGKLPLSFEELLKLMYF